MFERIYFDNAASTRTDPRVRESMLPFFSDYYGNASSLHYPGSKAKSVLSACREQIADAIKASPEEIFFTSSGTESNNLALKGIASAHHSKGRHIIVSAIEHDCILNTCKWLQSEGFEISYIPVDRTGLVDINTLIHFLRKDTILVSVMHVNNELGTIEPIEAIGQICSDRKILFHSDACQSFGKIALDASRQKFDLLTLNSHKIYGPKGAAALYVRKGTLIQPLLHGGGQESGLRSSTENIPGIVGFSKAAEIAINEMNSEFQRIKELRSVILTNLRENHDQFYINGHEEISVPHILNFSLHGLEGETIRLLLLLDDQGIAVSAGSACSSNSKSENASHVLQAIGLNQFEARGGIRISLGRFNTMEEVQLLNKKINNIVGQLNSIFS